jgi:Spy/CpxP family protein refolding chaperone
MRTKILTIAALIVMSLGLKAQPPVNGGVGPSNQMRSHVQMTGRMEALKKSLNLTAEQKEDIKKIRLAMSKELTPLRNKVGESAAHLKTLTSTDKPDMAAINQTLEKTGAQKTEIAKAEMKYRMQMRSVFTEEQLVKLQAIKARMKQMQMHGMRNNAKRFSQYRS